MPDEVRIIITAIGIAVALVGLYMLVQEGRLIRQLEPAADEKPNVRHLEFLGLRVPVSQASSVLVIGVGMLLLAWLFPESGNAAAPEMPTPTTTVTTPAGAGEDEPLATILFEAEDGNLIEPFAPFADSSASGGGYIASPDAPQNPEEPGTGVARYTLEIETPGRYLLWARVRVADSDPYDKNSVFIRLESDGPFDVWDFFEGSAPAPAPGWHWELVSTRCDGTAAVHSCNPRRFSLSEGEEVITLSSREQDAAIDAFALTLDPDFTPTE